MARTKKSNNDVVEEKKKTYSIILATPTYFVYSKDGSSVVVRKLNNYKRGDTITL